MSRAPSRSWPVKADEKLDTPPGDKAPRGRTDNGDHDQKHPDGRFKFSKKGDELCDIFNYGAPACSSRQCKYGRQHYCQWCRSAQHPAVNCPDKPRGWEPPAPPRKGKGKGDKGGGNPPTLAIKDERRGGAVKRERS